ncbi:MAG: M16 family metallopeptidase [Gemmatimonadota bacterium]
MKKNPILAVTAVLVASATAFAQGPQVPPPLPMGPIAFPAFAERTLKSGAQTIVVENHEQPVVSINIYIRGAGSTADPAAKPGVASMVASLLEAGTKSKTSKQIAQTIEGLGANVSTSATHDWATVSASMLAADVDAVLAVIADMLVNPTFPAEEVETERKRSLTDLQVALSRPSTLAQRQFESRVFGKHPYGRVTTTAALRALTREDLVAFHQASYKPSNALIVVAGDVAPAEITAKLERQLGAWRGSGPARPQFAAASTVAQREIVLVNKPGAVQASFRIGHTIVPATNADWPALTVAQYILGGGSNGWLYSTLREQKGFTYGAYAQSTQRLDPGYFMLWGDVRNEVADSAFQLFIDLATRLRAEPVSASDLELAKAYLTGNFPLTIETPQQIAGQVAQARLLGQARDHVQTWRQRLAAVTAADVQRVAQQHYHPEQALVVISGDASVLKPKLEQFGKVTVVDEEGRPVVADAPQAGPANIDASALQPMTLQYTVSAQGNVVAEMTRVLTREKLEGKEVVRSKGTGTGMQTVNADLVFEAKTFAPISANLNMQMGGQEMTQLLAVAGGKVTGSVKMPQMPEPQAIDAALAEGVLLPGMDEFAIWLTPWDKTRELKLSLFNAQSRSVVPVTVKLTGESRQTVAAGEFDVYELDTATAQGAMKVYVRKAAPHILVKQEFLAAPVVIELKSLK